MRALFLLLCSLSFSAVSVAEPWVLHYSSGSNWGPEGVVWITSGSNVVVGDGDYTQNVPCEGTIDETQLAPIDALIQELIVVDPPLERLEEFNICDDEPRYYLQIALAPQLSGVLPNSQRTLQIDYSPILECNRFKVPKLWLELVAAIRPIMEARLSECHNTPFSNS